MNRSPFLLVSFLVISAMGMAQSPETPPKTYEQIQAELIDQLKAAGQDTTRVWLLLVMSDFHWRKSGHIDSSIMYAGQARELSKRLRFSSGLDEACFFLCRALVRQNRIAEARQLLSDVSNDWQPQLVIRIGEEFLFRPTLKDADLDSAYKYFTYALQKAEELGSQKWRHESLIALGKYYFASNKFAKGKSCFLSIIDDFKQVGDSSSEAHIWSELGKYMPDNDSTMQEQLAAHGYAMKLYQALKDTNNERSVLEDIAAIHMYHQKFDLARTLFKRAAELRKAVGNKTLYKDYVAIAWMAHAVGDLDEALSYAVATEKNLESLSLPIFSEVDMLFGQIYSDEGQADKSLQRFLKATNAKNEKWNHFVCKRVVDQYIRLNQPDKALSFLLNYEKTRPPKTPADQETIAGAKGDCYAALKNFALAEKYYKEMIELDDQAQKHSARELLPFPFMISGPEAYYKIANFYTSQKKHNAASAYLAKALAPGSFAGESHYTSSLMRKLWLLKFKTDSASGNYAAAIRSYQRYTSINDSIFNVDKSRQFQQLEVQYETAKKENDIKTRDQQIETLTQNAQLRQANLEQANLITKITIAIVGILILSGALLFRQYLQKQRSSKMIQLKNTQLEHLVTEKEWLLKEVHHRVKNNLHTIICLLESQAIYLQDDALKAIENSQHRVYAMSLIHQKLYQADNVKTIEMSDYLPEFIHYLKDGFGISRDIAFVLDVEPLQLDVSKAVPVALIINEAVTNSIKYAFQKKKEGNMIKVGMQNSGDDIILTIADNGVGITPEINETQLNSLGLALMKGLCEDIRGHIEFENNHGTRITITFKMEPIYEDNNIQDMVRKEVAIT